MRKVDKYYDSHFRLDPTNVDHENLTNGTKVTAKKTKVAVPGDNDEA